MQVMKRSVPPRIEILLGTFNSERYLEAQLESILTQTVTDFRLLIRDGGSEDRTREIIDRYRSAHPDRIVFLETGSAKACENFSRLTEASEAELVMYADHDDVWHPEKLAMTERCYREAEKRYGKSCPILVFTDRIVTDSQLNKLSDSSFQFQKLDPEKTEFRRLLLQNIPVGNTMLVNRALLERARPIPYDAVMHDHWLALVAAAFGRIVYLPEPTLLYRQHEKNVFGARRVSPGYFLNLLIRGRRLVRERLSADFHQAEMFLERYGDELSARERDTLQACARIPEAGFFRKRYLLLRYGIGKQGMLRTLGLFLLV